MKILVKNGIVVTDEYEKRQNVFIEDGIIRKVEENYLAEADVVIDAEGAYVLSGLVDAHCHLRDPGYKYKDCSLYTSLSSRDSCVSRMQSKA